MNPSVSIVRQGEGETLKVLGVEVRFLCRAEDTRRAWSLRATNSAAYGVRFRAHGRRVPLRHESRDLRFFLNNREGENQTLGVAVGIVRALALLGLMAVSPLGIAQSVFNGTWRPDPQTFSPTRKPDVVELVNGVYDCQTCTPPYKIKADGHDQVITRNPYYDTLSITTVDDRTVTKIAKKGGKVVLEAKVFVSAGGKTKTEVQTMYDLAPRPMELTIHSSRVSGGSRDSHLVSGAWRMTDLDVSNHAEDTIFKINGDTLAMSDRLGRSFSAKLDGTEAPYKGSDDFTSVSLKMIDSHTIEESDKKGGKVVKISRWSVDPDGKTMHARFDDTQGHVQEQTGHKVQ
jgi:hypothetical protein